LFFISPWLAVVVSLEKIVLPENKFEKKLDVFVLRLSKFFEKKFLFALFSAKLSDAFVIEIGVCACFNKFKFAFNDLELMLLIDFLEVFLCSLVDFSLDLNISAGVNDQEVELKNDLGDVNEAENTSENMPLSSLFL
jgi:hypothetical protein